MKKNSFGSSSRLGRETSKVIEEGRRRREDSVVIYILESSRPRLSVIVGRKTGKSHDRNRLKRWTREIFRTRNDFLDYDTVVIYKPGAGEYSFEELKARIIKIWKELGILKQ